MQPARVPAELVTPQRLLDLPRVAKCLRMTRSSASEIVSAPDFPVPRAVRNGREYWCADDIDAWMAASIRSVCSGFARAA